MSEYKVTDEVEVDMSELEDELALPADEWVRKMLA